jgi:hypothetical protein
MKRLGDKHSSALFRRNQVSGRAEGPSASVLNTRGRAVEQSRSRADHLDGWVSVGSPKYVLPRALSPRLLYCWPSRRGSYWFARHSWPRALRPSRQFLHSTFGSACRACRQAWATLRNPTFMGCPNALFCRTLCGISMWSERSATIFLTRIFLVELLTGLLSGAIGTRYFRCRR